MAYTGDPTPRSARAAGGPDDRHAHAGGWRGRHHGDRGEDPVVTTTKKWEREEIPPRTITKKTARLDRGVRKVVRPGRAGVRVKVVQTTRHDGVVVKRKVVRNFVARHPRPRVVLVGTRADKPDRPRCDPNYSGCVPIASDVDCAGGSGNGPKYVEGPVRVIGDDIYDLDADGDGWGCE